MIDTMAAPKVGAYGLRMRSVWAIAQMKRSTSRRGEQVTQVHVDPTTYDWVLTERSGQASRL